MADALDGFPALRTRYRQVEQSFPEAFATATLLFGQRFQGFPPPPLPIRFVHSLGRMDGGTRTLGGRSYMIFGADVIARLHDDGTIGPFLDHELFHVENGRWFGDCDPDTTLWCTRWQEGTAVYNASAMNPGATDHMLMLDNPGPDPRGGGCPLAGGGVRDVAGPGQDRCGDLRRLFPGQRNARVVTRALDAMAREAGGCG